MPEIIEPEPNGITCPTCRSRRIIVTARALPVPQMRVKYLECRDCETGFKVREQFAGITRPPKKSITPAVTDSSTAVDRG